MKAAFGAGLVALVMLAPLAPAHSEDLTAQVKLAREVIERIHVEATLAQVLPKMLTQIRDMLVAQKPELAKDLDLVLPELQKKIFSRLDEFKLDVAKIYASKLSETELRDILAFYESPTGTKLVALQPELAKEGMQLGQAWGQRVAAETVEDMKAELRKRGHNI